MLATIRLRALGAAFVVMLATAACGSDATLPDGDNRPQQLKPLVVGFNPALVVGAGAPGAVTAALELLPLDMPQKLGSVQGVLEYDPQRVQLAGASIGSGLLGAWREVQPGTIRFAVAAEDGLDAAPVLSLSFQGAAALNPAWFTLRLEKVVAVDDYHDLGGFVVGGGAVVVR